MALPPPAAGKGPAPGTGDDPYADVRRFCEYFDAHCQEDVADLLTARDPRRTHWLMLDVTLLCARWPQLGYGLLLRAEQQIEAAEAAVRVCQQRMLQRVQGGVLKPYVRVQLVGIPPHRRVHKSNISDLRTEDVGQIIVVRGTVVRGSLPRIYERHVPFRCGGRSGCGEVTLAPCMSPAVGCAAEVRPPMCGSERCNGKGAMTMLPDSERQQQPLEYRDCQELRLQDSITRLRPGAIPRVITVYAEDDLSGVCKAGDDIVVTGALFHRWITRPGTVGRRAAVELVIRANAVRVTNEDKGAQTVREEDAERFAEFWRQHRDTPLRGRDLLVSSLCPVYGMHDVKLALALVLVGGLAKGHGGNTSRSEPHLLLVGDPGTAKSQFLQAAARLCARSVFTTGIGSTSAGLTASAVKDQGEWVLDAGALVMADGGVCCIDEFNTIPDSKHTGLHEAMEQQTISMAKAGLVVKLSTKCTVVAACNPRKSQTLRGDEGYEFGVATPLLSRFDLVMRMADRHDPTWDEGLADFLLKRAENPKRGGAGAVTGVDGLDWDVPTLRAYFAWVKARKKGIESQGGLQLTAAAAALIQRHYNAERVRSGDGAATARSRCTVRMLESLIRLSQAHCLLCNGDVVGLRDAAVAVLLMRSSGGADDLDDDDGDGGCCVHSVPSASPDMRLARLTGQLIRRLRLEQHPAVVKEAGEWRMPDPPATPAAPSPALSEPGTAAADRAAVETPQPREPTEPPTVPRVPELSASQAVIPGGLSDSDEEVVGPPPPKRPRLSQQPSQPASTPRRFHRPVLSQAPMRSRVRPTPRVPSP